MNNNKHYAKKGDNYADYTGRRFGKLLCIKKVNENNDWLYKCDCGNEIIINGYKIHWRKSCGCLTSESAMTRQYKNRRFDKMTESSEYLIFKNNCLQRGLIPLIKKDWLEIIYQPCHYCGDIDIRNHATSKSYLKSRGKSLKDGDIERYAIGINGVDRIDSTQGYEPGNCVPCCGMCNRMKNSFSKELFLSKIDKIYHRLLNIINSGAGCSREPVEMSAIVESMKQEKVNQLINT